MGRNSTTILVLCINLSAFFSITRRKCKAKLHRNNLYWFPVAVITNDHKLGDWKQKEFILTQFWRPAIQNQGSGRAMLPLGVNPSLVLPPSVGSRLSLACDHNTPISASVFTCLLPCASLSSLLSVRRTLSMAFSTLVGNPGGSHLKEI